MFAAFFALVYTHTHLSLFTPSGHGYLSSVLPPPADALRDMRDQQTGSSALLAAGIGLAESLLLLVPKVLGALAHLSPEMPLQQYWAAVSCYCTDGTRVAV
jgi:hypothetical protein